MFHAEVIVGSGTGSSLLAFRTLVVDDYRPFLEHVCSVLRKHPGLELIGTVEDGLKAVERAADLQPDLVLLDIGLPGLNGIDVAHRIRTVAPSARIVFLTQESSPEIVTEALRLGAWAYVIKASAARELPAALDAVMRGNKFVSPALEAKAEL